MRAPMGRVLSALIGAAILVSTSGLWAEVYGLEGLPEKPQAKKEINWPRQDQELVTGLDVTWQWRDGARVVGPSLVWGLSVMPGYLDLEASVGAVLGDERYAIPVSFTLKGHLWVAKWFVPYAGLGVGVVHEKLGPKEDWNDLQGRAVVGAGINLPGLEWRFFVEGVYVLYALADEHHAFGVTPGFRYRF